MAARSFVQSNTAAPSGAIAACSGATVASATAARLAVEGGGAGSTPASPNARVSRASVMFEIAPAQAGWSAGNWTIRLNVTTANAGVTWASTYVCRRTSGGSAVTSWSETGSPVSLGTTGVKTMSVAATSHVGSATDIAYIVLVMTTAGPTLTFGITPNQTIDSPILEPITGSGAPAMAGFGAAGVGSPTVTGSGGPETAGFEAAGAGSPTVTGSGVAAMAGFGASGEGAATLPTITGSGAAAMAGFGAAGVGSPTAAGSGAPAMAGFGAAGAGSPTVTGSGAPAMAGFGAQGIGAGAYDLPAEAILTPAWIDGAELDGSAAAAAELYATADVSEATYEAGHMGGRALASRSGDVRLVTPAINPSASWAVTIRVKASAPVERRLVGLWYGDPDSSGTLEAELVMVPAGDGGVRWRLEARSGDGTILGASTSIGAGAWTRVGFRVTLGDVRFGEVEMRLDGVRVLDLSGVVIRSSSSGGIANTVEIGAESDGTSGSWVLVDDIAILSTLARDLIARATVPAAAGDITDWTPSAGANYAAVDDSPGTDADSTYVAAPGGAADIDLYSMAPLSAVLGDVVHAVRYDVAARVTAGSVDVLARVRSAGGGDATIKQETVSATSYVRIRGTTTLSPYGGGRLERADIDAQQAGVEA